PSSYILCPYTTLFRSFRHFTLALDCSYAARGSVCCVGWAILVHTAWTPRFDWGDCNRSVARLPAPVGSSRRFERAECSFLYDERSEEHTSELQSRVDL